METPFIEATVTELQRKESDFVKKCREYAIDCHNRVNQLYDGKPYSYHLEMAVDFGYLFIDLIPEKDRDNVIGGIYNHDGIEDTGITYNDLRKATNEKVANIGYALSNEKGKTREERANAKYYRGIRKEEYADYGKLCDRMANVKNGIKQRELNPKSGKMLDKYYAGNPKFIWSLIKPEWYEIHQYALRLFIGHKNYFRYRKSRYKYAVMILHLENMFNYAKSIH